MFNRRNPPLYIRIIYLGVALLLGVGAIGGVVILAFDIGGTSDVRSQFQERIEEAESALQEDPDDARALEEFAAAHLGLASPDPTKPGEYPINAEEHYSEAIRALEKARKLEPDDVGIAEALATAYREKATYEQLKTELVDDTGQKNQQELAATRANALHTKAQAIWADLVEQEPDNADYFYYWGDAASSANNTTVATLAFQRYLRLEPDGPQAADVKERLKNLTSPEGKKAASEQSAAAEAG